MSKKRPEEPSSASGQQPRTSQQHPSLPLPPPSAQPASSNTCPSSPLDTSNFATAISTEPNATSKASTVTQSSTPAPPTAKARRERPCDACRRRKSRCVMNEGADKCVLCNFHSQECTFVQSPQPRKRRLPSTAGQSGDDPMPRKKRSAGTISPPLDSSKPIRESLPIADYSLVPSSSLNKTLGLEAARHSHFIGPTSEYEPCLIDLCPFDSKENYSLPSGGAFRRVGPYDDINDSKAFLMLPDEPTPNHASIFPDADEIERVIAPHGEKLIRLYFRIVHPSFPILHEKVFLEKYARTHREFSPPLLAAMYTLALNWWTYDTELSPLKKPDVEALERLAMKSFADVIHRPKLSTVQAGLLLLQRNEELKGGSWAMTAQIIAVGHELGLHLDCSDWRIPAWEKALRKRLSWALYMQDKWGALTHGRPSLIAEANWAVKPVEDDDFPEKEEGGNDGEEEDGSQEVEKGQMLFEQMIHLTRIMADVLDTFFTVKAQNELSTRSGDGNSAAQKVLERAKPIQIRLKEWFARLPDCLRMETTTTKSRRLLHLSYFSTEITLHRQILRSLSPSSTDPYLLHICRSAAKTRLISAMDFVNRLKPEHLSSFWYFSSKVNFALIGTFGSLLWATAPDLQEAKFYKARLSEYRWTLRVSARGAAFMEFAVGVLDSSAGYLQQEEWRKRGLGKCEGYKSTVQPPPPERLAQKEPLSPGMTGSAHSGEEGDSGGERVRGGFENMEVDDDEEDDDDDDEHESEEHAHHARTKKTRSKSKVVESNGLDFFMVPNSMPYPPNDEDDSGDEDEEGMEWSGGDGGEEEDREEEGE